MAKADDYVTAGVKIVWLVDPMSRTVVEYRGSSQPKRYCDDEVLDAGEVIPGFRLKVADILQP